MKEGPSKGPQKDKKMPQKQAVAVALDVARRKGFKTAPDPSEQRSSAFDQVIFEKELTTQGRKQIELKNFAIPEKAPGSGSYPIQDLAHARNALARVSAHGSPAEQKKVRAAVYNKYPALKERSEERKEESMSVFDSITERELPESFKKNMGKFGSKPKDDDVDDDANSESDDGEEVEVEESSIFDSIVHTEGKSAFDDVVQESSDSIFDEIIDKGVDEASTSWDDRVARTMTLAEGLIELQSTIKGKK
jgi:hypothetical protein